MQIRSTDKPEALPEQTAILQFFYNTDRHRCESVLLINFS